MTKTKSQKNSNNSSTPFDKYYPIFRTLVGTRRKVQINTADTLYEGEISGLSSNSVGMLYKGSIITIGYELIQSYIILTNN